MKIVESGFYEFRKNEIRSIFRSHFGLSNAFDVVFYDEMDRMKRVLSGTFVQSPMSLLSSPNTSSPMHYPVSTMNSSSNLSMTEDQLNQMMRAYFNGDQSGGSGGDLSAVEKRRRIMEMTNGLFVEQQVNQQIAGTAPMDTILEHEGKEDAVEATSEQDLVEMWQRVSKSHGARRSTKL